MRRMWLFLGVLGGVGMVFVLVLVFASGSGAVRSSGVGSSSWGHGDGSDAGAGQRRVSEAQSARARRALDARRRRLGSPVARARRVRSRTAFSGLTVGSARRLLVGDYGSLLAGVSGNPAASVAHSGGVVRYLSDYRALVHGRHGLEVVTSSVPLRIAGPGGRKRPGDLRWVAAGGGFAAVRTLAGVSIARDSGGGVAVGGDGLRIFLEGPNVRGG